jgi:TetR/AcrR family transcriptional regulator, transcriptional repressor for nem operon
MRHGIHRGAAREKILAAAFEVIRRKGYSGATVDDLCAAAGVTKGAFFHHFSSKEDLAVEAARHWADTTGALFAAAPYHRHRDPLDRVLGYLAFRRALLAGSLPEITCLVGTMVQETYDTAPAIREACAATISGHAQTLEADIAAAMAERGIAGPWSARSLALHTQAVIQGAFILAKAENDVEVAADSIDHLKRYIELLFSAKPEARSTS